MEHDMMLSRSIIGNSLLNRELITVAILLHDLLWPRCNMHHLSNRAGFTRCVNLSDKIYLIVASGFAQCACMQHRVLAQGECKDWHTPCFTSLPQSHERPDTNQQRD
jgi:hypothetical protein